MPQYSYSITARDNFLSDTVYNLLFKEKVTPDSTFQYLLTQTNLKTKRTQTWVELDIREIPIRLEIEESELEEIISDYNLESFRLAKKKSGKILRGDTTILIPLQKYSNLVPIDRVREIIEKIQSDEDFKNLANIISENPEEYSTVQGVGVSEQTFNSWLQKVKQEVHNWKRKTEQLESLEQSLVEKESQELLSEETSRQLADTIERLNSKEKEIQILKDSLKAAESSATTTSKTIKMSDNSLKTVIDPPIWKTNTGFSANVEVDNYLRDLEIFKGLGLFPKESQLIYASLTKSGKSNV